MYVYVYICVYVCVCVCVIYIYNLYIYILEKQEINLNNFLKTLHFFISVYLIYVYVRKYVCV